MMKDKRIWIVIVCILAVGTGQTKYTHSYISSRSGAASAQTGAPAAAAVLAGRSAEQEAAGQEAAGQPEAAAYGMERSAIGPGAQPAAEESIAKSSAAAEKAGPSAVADDSAGSESISPADLQNEEEAQAAAPEEAAAAEVPISPLVGARAAEGRSAAGTDYRQRLEDLDTQIERIQSEEQESNVYSSMTSAESELKMWESELNAIYSALLQALPEEEASELVQEQQEWMQNREARAAECTGKAGGSVENLGYAAALVSLTRDRAYELADRYDAAAG